MSEPSHSMIEDTAKIGIDLGGTKIELIVLSRDGQELYRRRVASPRGDYGTTLRTLRDLVQAAEEAVGVRASVGIGIPGIVSRRTGLVKNANSTWLIGHPFDRDLEELLSRPVRVENDANCFALSEATDGSASGKAVVFGVILGTGVGGGLVVNGGIVQGANAIAGEWGHNPLPWPEADELPGLECYCSRRGCIETFLSGPAFERDYRQKIGKALGAAAIVERAEAGDPQAVAVLERYYDWLARALAHLINIVDPAAIVLGGGLSQIRSLYEAVPERWSRYIFSDTVDTQLLPPKHGDASGVRGAAHLW